MSGKMVGHVLRHSRSEGAARLVLVALADIGNNDGVVDRFERSYKTLAERTHVGIATVSRAVKTLVEMGELEVLTQGSGRTKTDYRITVRVVEGTPPQDEHAHLGGDSEINPALSSEQPRVDEGATQPCPESNPGLFSEGGPSLRPSSSSLVLPSSSHGPTFDDFWRVYPKKTGKGAAKKRWDQATRKAHPSVIVEGAERYAREINGTPRTYVKNPEGWLSAERWTDEPGVNVRHHDTGVKALATADEHGESGLVGPEEL